MSEYEVLHCCPHVHNPDISVQTQPTILIIILIFAGAITLDIVDIGLMLLTLLLRLEAIFHIITSVSSTCRSTINGGSNDDVAIRKLVIGPRRMHSDSCRKRTMNTREPLSV